MIYSRIWVYQTIHEVDPNIWSICSRGRNDTAKIDSQMIVFCITKLGIMLELTWEEANGEGQEAKSKLLDLGLHISSPQQD